MTYDQLATVAETSGFTNWAPLDLSTIELKSEVRAMCADNTCGQYGKRWSCPPGCGTLEECEARIRQFRQGILLQTVGDIEDSFDFEAMVEIEAKHKQHFQAMYDTLRLQTGNVLALGAGCCTYCKVCSYPDKPCRHPDKMTASMEAFGILVLDVCNANSLPYYYGQNQIAYTSCIFL